MSTNDNPYCPECDSANIHRRCGSMQIDAAGQANWLCNACGTQFDDPNWREPQNEANKGLTKRLIDADPNEFSR